MGPTICWASAEGSGWWAAGGAAHLDASVRVGGGGLGGSELRHSGFLGVGLACPLEDGGAVREEPRSLETHRHVSQLELDRLELGDGLVEGLAVLRILGGTLERCRGDALVFTNTAQH